MKLIGIVRKLLNPLGIDIVRYYGEYISEKDNLKLLQERNVDLILDIGANTGQFAKRMLTVGYDKKIISFEPLVEAHKQLVIESHKYANWHVYERCAVGDVDGEISINVSSNSYSSSILPIEESLKEVLPNAKYGTSQKSRILKLDTIKGDYLLKHNSSIYLKIDTQGYEHLVLKGAESLLKSVGIIQIELSLLSLYKNSKLIDEMIPLLYSYGFEPYSYKSEFQDGTTGRLFQIEGLFVKSKKD